jgi:hypothetical protein
VRVANSAGTFGVTYTTSGGGTGGADGFNRISELDNQGLRSYPSLRGVRSGLGGSTGAHPGHPSSTPLFAFHQS